MNTLAEIIARLIAGGTPPDVAAIAVAEAFAAGAVSGGSPVDKTAERRRVYDRNRKAEERKVRGSPRKSGGSPVEIGGNAPLSILPFFIESQGIQKEEIKKEVQSSEPRARVKRGARLPDDWQPSEIDRKYAADRGMRLVEIEIEATKFRNYWTNRTDKQAAKPRWDRAWQNWILNVKGTTKNGHGTSVIDAADRLVEKLREWERPDMLGDLRSGASPPDVRLLPPK